MSATSAKQVEAAKKTAESVWVVEHATRCPDGGCGVAGCSKARNALEVFSCQKMSYELQFVGLSASSTSKVCFGDDHRS